MLLYLNPWRLPFAWENQLDVKALKSMAWEEDNERGLSQRMMKILDIPYWTFQSLISNSFTNVMKRLELQHAVLKRNVPRRETNSKLQQNERFPQLGRNFLVMSGVGNAIECCLCLLCEERLSEDQFYAHVFSRKHVTTFLVSFNPGSLNSGTDPDTLLDLAKQATRIHRIFDVQVITLEKSIWEPCSYHTAIAILASAKRREGKGNLEPLITPGIKLVPRGSLKDVAKDHVRDTSQKNTRMMESGEKTSQTSTDKSETTLKKIMEETGAIITATHCVKSENAEKGADKETPTPNEKESERSREMFSETSSEVMKNAGSVTSQMIKEEKTEEPIAREPTQDSCQNTDKDDRTDTGKERSSNSQDVLKQFKNDTDNKNERKRSHKSMSAQEDMCPNEDAETGMVHKRQCLTFKQEASWEEPQNKEEDGNSIHETKSSSNGNHQQTHQLWQYIKMKSRDPVIGLSALLECLCDQRPPIYLCECCSQKILEKDIISHVTGFYHQKIYLAMLHKLPTPPEKDQSEQMRLLAASFERDNGYGEAQVTDLDEEIYNNILKQDFKSAIQTVKAFQVQQFSYELTSASPLSADRALDASVNLHAQHDSHDSATNFQSTKYHRFISKVVKMEIDDDSDDCEAQPSSASAALHVMNETTSEVPSESHEDVKVTQIKVSESAEKAKTCLTPEQLVSRASEDASNLHRSTRGTNTTCLHLDSNGNNSKAEIIPNTAVARLKIETTSKIFGTSQTAASSDSTITTHTKSVTAVSQCTAKSSISTQDTINVTGNASISGATISNTNPTTKSARVSKPTESRTRTASTQVAVASYKAATTSNTGSTVVPEATSRTAPSSKLKNIIKNSETASQSMAASQTVVTSGASAKMSVNCANTETSAKTVQMKNSTGSNADISPNIPKHNSPAPPHLTTLKSIRSENENPPTEPSHISASHTPASKETPSENLKIGINQLIAAMCRGKQQVYCKLCSTRLRSSSHTMDPDHQYKYLKMKYPEWTAKPHEYDSKFKRTVAHLAKVEKDLKFQATFQGINVTNDVYQELAALPERKGETTLGSSHLSTYLKVKGQHTQPVIGGCSHLYTSILHFISQKRYVNHSLSSSGLGFVWECRGVSVTLFLCESCQEKLYTSDICQHMVSVEHMVKYIVSDILSKHHPQFLSFLEEQDLLQEMKLELLTEVAWLLAKREHFNKIDAQIVLLRPGLYECVQVAPFSEGSTLKMVQNIKRGEQPSVYLPVSSQPQKNQESGNSQSSEESPITERQSSEALETDQRSDSGARQQLEKQDLGKINVVQDLDGVRQRRVLSPLNITSVSSKDDSVFSPFPGPGPLLSPQETSELRPLASQQQRLTPGVHSESPSSSVVGPKASQTLAVFPGDPTRKRPPVTPDDTLVRPFTNDLQLEEPLQAKYKPNPESAPESVPVYPAAASTLLSPKNKEPDKKELFMVNKTQFSHLLALVKEKKSQMHSSRKSDSDGMGSLSINSSSDSVVERRCVQATVPSNSSDGVLSAAALVCHENQPVIPSANNSSHKSSLMNVSTENEAKADSTMLPSASTADPSDPHRQMSVSPQSVFGVVSQFGPSPFQYVTTKHNPGQVAQPQGNTEAITGVCKLPINPIITARPDHRKQWFMRSYNDQGCHPGVNRSNQVTQSSSKVGTANPSDTLADTGERGHSSYLSPGPVSGYTTPNHHFTYIQGHPSQIGLGQEANTFGCTLATPTPQDWVRLMQQQQLMQQLTQQQQQQQQQLLYFPWTSAALAAGDGKVTNEAVYFGAVPFTTPANNSQSFINLSEYRCNDMMTQSTRQVYLDPGVAHCPPAHRGSTKSQLFNSLKVYLNNKNRLQPIIGLSSITECVRAGTRNTEALYLCEVCVCRLTKADIRNHIMGSLHRYNYIKAWHPHLVSEWKQTSDLSKLAWSLMEIARLLEEKEGPGDVHVCSFKCLLEVEEAVYQMMATHSENDAVTLINILRDGLGEPESHSETAPVHLQQYPTQSQRIVLLGRNQQRCSKKSLKTSAQSNKPPSLIRQTAVPPIRSGVWLNNSPSSLLDSTQTSSEPSESCAESYCFLDDYTGTEPLIGLFRVVECRSEDGRTYCFLCHCCRIRANKKDIIHHLTSPSHLRNYLMESHPEQVEVETADLNDNYELLQSLAKKVEQEEGRGELKVVTAPESVCIQLTGKSYHWCIKTLCNEQTHTTIQKRKMTVKGPSVTTISNEGMPEKCVMEAKRETTKRKMRKVNDTVFKVSLPLTKGPVLLERMSFSRDSVLGSSADSPSPDSDLSPVSQSEDCELDYDSGSYAGSHAEHTSVCSPSQQKDLNNGDGDAGQHMESGRNSAHQEVDGYFGNNEYFNWSEDQRSHRETNYNRQYDSQERSKLFYKEWQNEGQHTQSEGLWPAVSYTQDWSSYNSSYGREEGCTEQRSSLTPQTNAGIRVKVPREATEREMSLHATQYYSQQQPQNQHVAQDHHLLTGSVGQRAQVSRKLTFLYLANDVIQNSKKKGPEFTQDFAPVIVDAFKHVYRDGEEGCKKQLGRVLSIWQERAVYENNLLDQLSQVL
ncbi:hypothetical protein L3Q82_014974 [Scortum barcoo]|uniref:Uncharacterized protein n=1 Tax=Scortum barcoo TaxID=214431 RepID=A0ACB8VSG9_9TELE|nr:hypothetical protein L3Q82_014974 [Scortum barcoo]